MKTPATLLALSTLALALGPLGAADAAFTWCAEPLNEFRDPDCQHLVCLGRSTYTWNGWTRERCTLSEDNIPDLCHPRLCDPATLP